MVKLHFHRLVILPRLIKLVWSTIAEEMDSCLHQVQKEIDSFDWNLNMFITNNSYAGDITILSKGK